MPEETVLQASRGSRFNPATRKRVMLALLLNLVWGAILFGAAGRLDWARGWVYFGLCLLSVAVNSVVVFWKNPGLVAERWKRHTGTKPFDKVFMVLYTPAVFALPVVAGLDAGRFGWAPLPWPTLWCGIVLQLLAIPPVAWSMATNPHLEATVRIQHDRGHQVIATGPYALVRHPMYVGALLSLAGGPLVLGSAWAYAPAGFAVLLFVFRTALEDRTLRRELPGYEEYAQRTRYRLVPGLW